MRTRFAPSPTGFLHVGALRTALYAYIAAKQSGGEFLVRIEDTDQERSVEGAVENILRTLHKTGINPDEGVMLRDGCIVQEGSMGPYIQSERLDLYRKYADQLLESGHAYPCFCSSERLDTMRKEQQAKKQAPMYDRLCCSLNKEEQKKRIEAGENHVIRMKVPHDQLITFSDLVRGQVEFKGHTIDDQVLLKSDGFPTYHLAHVVDDHLMDIQLVIRGEEWLSSLPKHILLFEFLGWKEPQYAHVPLLLNTDKSKLSKRQCDVAAEEYLQKGYLPEALVNFLALLGWNPGSTKELFSMEELIDEFSIERIQKSGAIFDTEKLDWIQGQWIRQIPIEEFAKRILPFVTEKYPEAGSDAGFQQKAALIQERITFFPEAPEMLSYYYKEPKFDLQLVANPQQKITKEMLPEIIDNLIERLEKLEDWRLSRITTTLSSFHIQLPHLKKGQYLWPLRAILTGLPYSPGAFEVAAILGKEKTLKRLQAAKRNL